jgi:hypothetical protein
MQSRAALLALLAVALHQSGCATGSTGLPNAPVFNTGVSATIIPPGQSAPAMPGYGQQSSSSYPGGSSGSYSGAYSGVPGAGAPGQLYPTGQPPAGNDMSMLGGAVTIDTRNIRRRQDALWSNPLFWPFAAVAWPFVKLDRAINAERDARFRQQALERIYQQTGVAMPERYPYASHQEAQVAQERAQQEAMARQLMDRGAAGSDGAGSALAPGPGLSIAEELEALRNAQSSAPAVASAVAAPTANPTASPVPGAAAADEVDDRDGDGRIDRWLYDAGGRRRELLDEDRDGRPERTVVYEADGEHIARTDEDTDGDGEIDSWTVYQNGELSRRRSDTDGDGEADTWTFYQGGQVVRQEEDGNGDGIREKVSYYEKGKLVRLTEDADGDGRAERTTLFDDKGRPTALEEDKDGDGKVDVRSHYSAGKLVRRELLDEKLVP